MIVLALAAYGGLTALCGATLVSLVSAPLRLTERALIAVVCGIVAGSAATYGLALLAGLNWATTLAGPALLSFIAIALARLRGGWLRPWREAMDAARASWRGRPPIATVVYAAVVALIVALLFAHTVYTSGADLVAGYQTVWADWSQHLSTASSFAVAGNVPSHNPLFSGTPLLYPFLPDFQSAELIVLGVSPGASLAVPGALLVFVIALLVVSLAERLGLRRGAGMIAAAVCFLGGGLGFIGVFHDACAHGFAAAQCTASYVITHPAEGVHVVAGTFASVPGVIADQTKAYDGLLTAPAQQPLPNMSWYTPLFAWWLPQRTFVYGFAAALSVFVMLRAALAPQDADRPPLVHHQWGTFALAGLLLGLLLLVHIQTFLVVALVLAVWAVLRRRREWIGTAVVALPLLLPRLVQLALVPHGAATSGNQYPWLEPGWIAFQITDQAHAPALPAALVDAVRDVFSGQWWGFWFVNLGVAVPLSALLLIALGLRALGGTVGAHARRLTSFMTQPLIVFSLIGIAIFAACNLVVFQSWDWDNTKLFVYWYLAVGLVVGALVTQMTLRRWQTVLLAVLPASMLLTGAVVMLRLLPWTPAADAVTGPYTLASSDERTLAADVSARTAGDAVFLTLGRPNDPLLTVGGRTAVMGYPGWLWSYGLDYQPRLLDEQVMYAGCSGSGACDVTALLRKYGIDYVEIDDRDNNVSNMVNTGWWGSQGFPVVARSEHIVVYDVRRAG